jgi:hypothetical protein
MRCCIGDQIQTFLTRDRRLRSSSFTLLNTASVATTALRPPPQQQQTAPQPQQLPSLPLERKLRKANAATAPHSTKVPDSFGSKNIRF